MSVGPSAGWICDSLAGPSAAARSTPPSPTSLIRDLPQVGPLHVLLPAIVRRRSSNTSVPKSRIVASTARAPRVPLISSNLPERPPDGISPAFASRSRGGSGSTGRRHHQRPRVRPPPASHHPEGTRSTGRLRPDRGRGSADRRNGASRSAPPPRSRGQSWESNVGSSSSRMRRMSDSFRASRPAVDRSCPANAPDRAVPGACYSTPRRRRLGGEIGLPGRAFLASRRCSKAGKAERWTSAPPAVSSPPTTPPASTA